MEFLINLTILEYISNMLCASRLKKRMIPEPVPSDSNFKLSLANSVVCFVYTWLATNYNGWYGLAAFVVGQLILEWYLRYLSKL